MSLPPELRMRNHQPPSTLEIPSAQTLVGHVYEQGETKTGEKFVVRGLDPQDPQTLKAMMEIDHTIWPEKWWTDPTLYQSRLRIFPAGVIGFYVVRDGKEVLAGFTTAMGKNYDPAAIAQHIEADDGVYTWDHITDNGTIVHHQEDANAHYVVSVGMGKDFQGVGGGGKLVQAQVELARLRGKEHLYLGARLPNLAAWCEWRGIDPKTMPRQELIAQADHYAAATRGDYAEFCAKGVKKPYDVSIRKAEDAQLPLPFEVWFYNRAGQLEAFKHQGKVRTVPGFAGGYDEESLDFGIIVHRDIA